MYSYFLLNFQRMSFVQFLLFFLFRPTGQGSGKESVWTSWSEWSTCSKSCDEGRQLRNRTCLSPSQCFDGENQEEKSCNSHKCKGKYNFYGHKTSCDSLDVLWVFMLGKISWSLGYLKVASRKKIFPLSN